MKLNMTKANQEKFLKNLWKFSAPILAILFAQLATGVNWKPACLVALYALYAAVSDYFAKIR